MVKQAEMVLAFTSFQPESNLCFGGTGWTVEMAKLLHKILYMYDVQRHIWLWYKHDQDLFYACDQMSEDCQRLSSEHGVLFSALLILLL